MELEILGANVALEPLWAFKILGLFSFYLFYKRRNLLMRKKRLKKEIKYSYINKAKENM